jgi:aspartyl-tRNA(Asn)/glutamyl-tRNA(Gln) amidotransferase subunit C
MALSKSEVQHIAQLARLELTEEEIARYQKQLSAILDYITMLQELNTDAVEPTSQVTGLQNILRSDTQEQSLSNHEALANAPDKEEGFFKVKPVIE